MVRVGPVFQWTAAPSATTLRALSRELFMRRVLMIAVAALAMAACKKDKEAAPAATGGSAAATASGAAPAADPAPTPTETPPAPATTDTAKVATGSGAPAATPPATGGSAAPTTAPTAPGARPASITDAQVAALDTMFAVMGDLGKAITAAGKDCKAVAAALTSNVAKMKPVMAEAGQLQASLTKDAAAMEWFTKTYQPKMMALAGPIMAAQQNCGQDKDYQAASAALQAEMTKHSAQ
jgi:hypothetical protein